MKKNIKILIAEDNVVSAAYLKELLNQYSTHIDIVYDGLDAYIAGREKNYDYIFMDFQMPLMNGIEASRKIKNERVNLGKPNPTIIACCASDNSHEKMAWNEIGIKEIIIKPISLETIEFIMNQNSKSDKNVEHNPVSMKKNQLYSIEKLVGMSRGNDEFVAKMIDLFVTDMPTALENIKTNIDQKDFQRVKAIIHRIKPSIKMLCITSIEEDVENIEKFCEQNMKLDKIPEIFNQIKKTCEIVISTMKSETI